jgi:CheY-like chemotaxis protein
VVARAEAGASRSPGSGWVPRSPPCVLLVDDDDDSRELCAEYLEGAGFEVVQAGNGVDAVGTAIGRHPDLVVMDLEMPEMDGLAAIQTLKDDTRTCAIPIIVLSATGDVDQAKASRVGCETCLVKPCVPDELEGVIRAVIDTSRMNSLDSAPRSPGPTSS